MTRTPRTTSAELEELVIDEGNTCDHCGKEQVDIVGICEYCGKPLDSDE